MAIGSGSLDPRKIVNPRKSSRSKSDENMDEPINIQGATEDMPDETAAALFQHQWQLYRKFVDNRDAV